MPSRLAGRLARLAAQLPPPTDAARYVVAGEADFRRVLARFPVQDYERPDAARRYDPSLPPEERLTYEEAVAEGVVVEAPAWRAAKGRGANDYAEDYRLLNRPD